jgi:hypothetical protein
VYKTVPHITLKSIANNEPPATETLYDSSNKKMNVTRYAGFRLPGLLLVLSSSINHGLYAAAFSLPTTSPPVRVKGGACLHNNVSPSVFPLLAIIYGPYGSRMEDGECDDTFVEESSKRTSILSEEDPEMSFRKAFQAQVDPRQLLRVACAQAQPPHDQIHPSQVTDINLVSVSLDQIQVGLGIAQSEGTAVQLLVPIAFHSCETLNDMVEQLQTIMDPQAIIKIREMEQRQRIASEPAAQQILLAQLSIEPSADNLPQWWTGTELQEGALAEECTNLKRLLNEDDFASNVRGLAIKYGDTISAKTIVEARVAVVGPAGLYLRGLVEVDDAVRVPSSSTIAGKTIVPITIRFDSTASNAKTLRSNVLNLMDALEDEVEKDVGVEPPVSLSVEQARRQSRSPEDDAGRLAVKYAAISDLGERAYTILKDLGMI